MTDKRLKPAVVLVADRTLSGDFKVLFEGIFATMQTTQVPEIFMRKFLSRPIPSDKNSRAKFAPLGLRRVESALIKYTSLSRDDIICTTPEALESVLGPWVKIVGVSSSDPLGMGMSNTTTTNFWKGELYSRYWTRQMLTQILHAKNKYHFKVIAGGAGAWQFNAYPDEVARQCIDIVFEGYFESSGPKLFTDLIEGRAAEKKIKSETIAADHIIPIKNPSTLGIIELSRGCGRGCRFCTMAKEKMTHLSPDTILTDLRTNVSAGLTSVVSGSEDFFRYGSTGGKPNFDALTNLLEQMRQVKNLGFMQIDHGNITSIAQLTNDQLSEIRRLLTWQRKSDYLWVNMGIESANGFLVAASAPGKIAPIRPEDWEETVKQTADRMTNAGFFSVFSIILGLPGETPDDVAKTQKLIEYLGRKHAVIFPIFYEPVRSDEIKAGTRFALDDLRADHLKLYQSCYEINFKQVPKLFWDNQRVAGVSFLRRSLMQLLGKCEVMSWRNTFKKIGKQIASKSQAPELKYAG